MNIKKFFVGINIAANELTEQIAINDELPKNYEVRSTNVSRFSKFLERNKTATVQAYDINGKVESGNIQQDDNELVVIIKK